MMDEFSAYETLNSTLPVTNSSYSSCQLRLNTRTIITLTLFTLIFCLSVIGNCMVIVTIVQNRWMRTVTNLFLLNLAISDLLLTLICMPPTLIGILFKCFLWGSVVCTALAYLQPVSVAACSFTLVVIAVERYNAICRPLQSRHWKTKKHAMVMIISVWILAFISILPSAFTSKLVKIGPGRYNCREEWSSETGHKLYLAFLTFTLLLIPLVVMSFLYCLVIKSLWNGMGGNKYAEILTKNGFPADEANGTMNNSMATNSSLSTNTTSLRSCSMTSKLSNSNLHRQSMNSDDRQLQLPPKTVLRSTHMEQNLLSKKRVIKMLAAIMVQFFVCWTPHYIYYIYLTVSNDYPHQDVMLTFLTLAYLSSCTNPVTYCFMNGKFRNAFLIAFGCSFLVKNSFKYTTSGPSLMLSMKMNIVEDKRRLSARRNAETAYNYYNSCNSSRRPTANTNSDARSSFNVTSTAIVGTSEYKSKCLGPIVTLTYAE